MENLQMSKSLRLFDIVLELQNVHKKVEDVHIHPCHTVFIFKQGTSKEKLENIVRAFSKHCTLVECNSQFQIVLNY
jgi:hypothetical protein